LKSKYILGLLIVLAIFLSLPMYIGEYWLHVAIISLFYVMMASSWNLLAGYTGQVSFAHAAFAGIGAYVSGIIAIKLNIPPMIGLFIGAIIAALFGLGLGMLCIKMGGIYLSLTTLAFSEIVRLIITNEYELTRGTMGLEVPNLIGFYSKTMYFYIMVAVTIIFLLILYKIINSDLGTSFRAISNDELAANSLGINVIRVRIIAFVISSAMAGFAGALFGHYLLLITPDISSLGQMFLILAMTIIGGMGSFAGPIIGAFFLEILSEYIRIYGEYHLLIFGIVALIIARFAPSGLGGIYQEKIIQKMAKS
jgi:branched-chain amino acid transport system permease protein